MLFLKIVLGLLAVYVVGFVGSLWAFRNSDHPVKDAALWPLFLLIIATGGLHIQ